MAMVNQLGNICICIPFADVSFTHLEDMEVTSEPVSISHTTLLLILLLFFPITGDALSFSCHYNKQIFIFLFISGYIPIISFLPLMKC